MTATCASGSRSNRLSASARWRATHAALELQRRRVLVEHIGDEAVGVGRIFEAAEHQVNVVRQAIHIFRHAPIFPFSRR
jgi:hypothetical protein